MVDDVDESLEEYNELISSIESKIEEARSLHNEIEETIENFDLDHDLPDFPFS